MGGSQSSRKLTLSNDDPASVIRVSDSVVQRFRGEKTDAVSGNRDAGAERGQGQAEGPSAAASVSPPRGPSFPTSPPPPLAAPRGPWPSHAGRGITSLQIRQEKEAELRANDAHWQRRINQLEETHQRINELMEREYTAAMSEMRDTLLDGNSAFGGKCEAPCADGKRAVLECYKSNARAPMLCAQQVKAFSDCVDKHRATVVSANRG